MKIICIYCTKVHGGYYLALGFIMNVISFNVSTNNHEWRDLVGYLGFLTIFFLLLGGIAFSEFYSLDERKSQNISSSRKGLVKWDRLFATKINTKLSISKRLLGYFYAISRPFSFAGIGYILSAIICVIYSAERIPLS